MDCLFTIFSNTINEGLKHHRYALNALTLLVLQEKLTKPQTFQLVLGVSYALSLSAIVSETF